jgi:LPXTG-motif cell wall-anchored protein
MVLMGKDGAIVVDKSKKWWPLVLGLSVLLAVLIVYRRKRRN